MNDRVIIDKKEGVIVKSVPRELLIVEVQMTQSAYDLASECKLFRVPKILQYDLDRQWVKLEYIPNIVPLFTLFLTSRSIGEIIEHCGKSVSYFHRNIERDEQDIVRIPSEFDRVGHKAFLHGDLNARNVQYDTSSNELVIIDWSLSPAVGRPGNWGSVYWDVAKFVRSIIVEPPVALTGRFRRRELADMFLRSYVAHSGLGPMGREFFEYCSRIHQFFSTENRRALQWYRYLRYALLNLGNFDAYVRERIADGRVIDGPVHRAPAQT